MKVFVYNTTQEASEKAYDVFENAYNNGANVFGLATGSTPEGLYSEIIKSDIDLSNCISINLDEYYGLDKNHPQSYNYYMYDNLFKHKPFKKSYVPNGMNKDAEDEVRKYNQIIDEHPIDFQLLGIGVNGHIGFNEPGTPFELRTHLVELTPSTVEVNSRFFDSIDEVPNQAYSMGIADIMAAKEVLLMAFGEAKAEAIKALIEGEVSEDVPVTCLKNHTNVTVILDQGSASLLSK